MTFDPDGYLDSLYWPNEDDAGLCPDCGVELDGDDCPDCEGP